MIEKVTSMTQHYSVMSSEETERALFAEITSYCPDGGCIRIHMAVTHSYCNELLTLVDVHIHTHTFLITVAVIIVLG